MKIVTYEQRVAKIKTPDDISKQIALVHACVVKNQALFHHADMLEDKIRISKLVKANREVEQKLKLNFYEIEDSLKSRNNQPTEK